MAEIRRFPAVRHFRAEPSSFVLRYRRGRLAQSGQGLSFWFMPMSAGIAEVPVEDREVSFLFHGRSADFQDVAVQGVITFRVTDPAMLAQRVDFSIDILRGAFLHQPIDRITLILTQLAQQLAQEYITRTAVRDVLAEGYEAIRQRVATGLTADVSITELGLAVTSVRVSSVKPVPDLEKAIEAPTREAIQQQADEAAFGRRALAVEKERAIQENELVNRIELARREEQLIDQEGRNNRRKAEEAAVAEGVAAEAAAARDEIMANASASRVKIQAEAESHQVRLAGAAQAESLALVEKAHAEGLNAQMAAYRDVRPAIVFGLALQELGKKLQSIENFSLSPEVLTPLLARLLRAESVRAEADGPEK